MGAVERIGVPPLAAGRIAASLLNRHSAGEIAEAVTVLIDVLDLLGGDPDLEDGDEDGQCNEDEISTNLHAQWGEGAGCEISDGDSEHDGREVDDGL